METHLSWRVAAHSSSALLNTLQWVRGPFQPTKQNRTHTRVLYIPLTPLQGTLTQANDSEFEGFFHPNLLPHEILCLNNIPVYVHFNETSADVSCRISLKTDHVEFLFVFKMIRVEKRRGRAPVGGYALDGVPGGVRARGNGKRDGSWQGPL